MRTLTLLSCLFAGTLWGCDEEPSPTVHVVLPEGYRGYFWVVVEEREKRMPVPEDRVYMLNIPEDGVLRLKKDPLSGWHRFVASYRSGVALTTPGYPGDDYPEGVYVRHIGGDAKGRSLFFAGSAEEVRRVNPPDAWREAEEGYSQ